MKVLTFIVVLCICIAVAALTTYFVIKNQAAVAPSEESSKGEEAQDTGTKDNETTTARETDMTPRSSTEDPDTTKKENQTTTALVTGTTSISSTKDPGTGTTPTSSAKAPGTSTTLTSSNTAPDTTKKENQTVTAPGTSTTLTSSSTGTGTGTTPTSSTKPPDTTKKENQTVTASGTSTTLTSSSIAPDTTKKENQTVTAPETTKKYNETTTAPGTSTTRIPLNQNVTFELSKSNVYIGDNDVQMACNISNYSGLTRVEIYQELQSIVNITTSNRVVNTSRVALKEGNITTSSAVVRIGFSNQVSCWDKGRYYCIVTGYRISNVTLQLDLLRKPSKPTLILSREIVEGKNTRDDLPFICEGDVGFPAGNLVLRSNFTSNFNPDVRNNNITISNESCQAYQKITFAYTFSANWHDKEILCFAVNNRSLGLNATPPFDKQLVKVVPATYCLNLERRLYYHPYNCNNFIDCVNGNENVNVCPANLCFSVNETEECNYCNWSLCAPNITATICPGSGAEAMRYPGLRCSMYVNCTDRMVHECPTNECFNVSNKTCPSWTRSITSSPVPASNTTTSTQVPSTTPIPSSTVITFELSKTEVYIGYSGLSMTCNVSNHQHLTRVEISSKLGTIASITQQSTYVNRTGVVVPQGAFLKENNASVKIVFTYNLTCNDNGMYDCKAIGNTTISSSINLNILSEPNVPALTLSPWIVENQATLSDRMFRCEGMVGKPASQMFVEANVSGLFERFNFPSVINNTEVSCNTNQIYQFSYTFSMSWHGRNVMCAVRNAKTNVTIRSQPKPIEVVPGNYCAAIQHDKFYPHPYECNKFIRCNNYAIIGIYECVRGTCFGVKETFSGGCTDCFQTDLMCLNGSRKPANS